MQAGDINFSAEELSRYNRHMIIPGFGLEGQKKLKAAKVLVVGCGGLGSPVLLYLAAAGVGTIGIVDFDLVDDSNLQRQVLYGTGDIGLLKVEAAGRKLKDLNLHIQVDVYDTKLTSENAMDIIKRYDVVADGTDNFPARYLINDACVLLGKPYVYASIHQFEGQVSVFNYKDADGNVGPNYRDLYPVPPFPGLIQDCAQGGVLGVLPGIIGSMQALEVIKVITRVGDILTGRLYMFDALYAESRVLNIKHDPENPLSGKTPTIKALVEYEEFCGASALENSVREITPQELKRWIQEEDIQIIDVRESHEYEMSNIGAQLIPLGSLEENIQHIDKKKKVVVHCKSGTRSTQAIRQLQQKFGFDNLYNLKGGIVAYQDQQ